MVKKANSSSVKPLDVVVAQRTRRALEEKRQQQAGSHQGSTRSDLQSARHVVEDLKGQQAAHRTQPPQEKQQQQQQDVTSGSGGFGQRREQKEEQASFLMQGCRTTAAWACAHEGTPRTTTTLPGKAGAPIALSAAASAPPRRQTLALTVEALEVQERAAVQALESMVQMERSEETGGSAPFLRSSSAAGAARSQRAITVKVPQVEDPFWQDRARARAAKPAMVR